MEKDFIRKINIHVKKMNNMIIELLTRLAKFGDAKSQCQLGIYCLDGLGIKKNQELAIKLLTKATQQKHKKALLILAYCYLTGIGVTKNRNRALELINEFVKLHGLDEPQQQKLFMQLRKTLYI